MHSFMIFISFCFLDLRRVWCEYFELLKYSKETFWGEMLKDGAFAFQGHFILFIHLNCYYILPLHFLSIAILAHRVRSVKYD